MCLLINQNRGVTIPRAELLDYWTRNADGFGACVWTRGGFQVYRTTERDEMLDLYARHAAGKNAVLHWRMGTSGTKGLENVHPFVFGDDGALVMHNGVLDVGAPLDHARSDTWQFSEYILRPLYKSVGAALFGDAYASILGDMIGTSNRLLLVHPNGARSIVNERTGVTYRGCWYSNTYAWSAPNHLKPVTRYSGYGGYGSSYSRAMDDYDDEARAITAGAPTLALDGPEEVTLLSDEGDDEVTCDSATLELMDSARAAWVGVIESDEGLLRWVNENPDGAAYILAAWHDYAWNEARALVTDDPEYVTDALADILGDWSV